MTTSPQPDPAREEEMGVSIGEYFEPPREPEQAWALAYSAYDMEPLIHDGTGVNDDPTTAARMFHMTWDWDDVKAVLSYLNALQQRLAEAERERGALLDRLRESAEQGARQNNEIGSLRRERREMGLTSVPEDAYTYERQRAEAAEAQLVETRAELIKAQHLNKVYLKAGTELEAELHTSPEHEELVRQRRRERDREWQAIEHELIEMQQRLAEAERERDEIQHHEIVAAQVEFNAMRMRAESAEAQLEEARAERDRYQTLVEADIDCSASSVLHCRVGIRLRGERDDLARQLAVFRQSMTGIGELLEQLREVDDDS